MDQTDPYVRWLGKNKNVYEIGGIVWTLYHGALVPASAKPQPIRLDPKEADELLRKSGAAFIRYFSKTFDEPTEFWYTACKDYSYESCSSETKRQIRRAYETCSVQRVDPGWLAANGYDCYAAAFARYQHARPISKESFKNLCLEATGGPFDYWAAFVKGQLAGFQKCIVGDDYVAGVVLKVHPDLLRFRPVYALADTVLKTYVGEQNKVVIAGFRSVVHKTNLHDFVLRFGYQKLYCDLCLIYRPSLRATINMLYPLKPLMDRIPADLTWKLRVLLAQEKIKRSFM